MKDTPFVHEGERKTSAAQWQQAKHQLKFKFGELINIQHPDSNECVSPHTKKAGERWKEKQMEENLVVASLVRSSIQKQVIIFYLFCIEEVARHLGGWLLRGMTTRLGVSEVTALLRC